MNHFLNIINKSEKYPIMLKYTIPFKINIQSNLEIKSMFSLFIQSYIIIMQVYLVKIYLYV